MPNQLKSQRSPYLQQHANNPVDWYPWSNEAFEMAKREDKPVFLSIGYSTCHWCHVMAHESFEDEEVANYLNDHFISIKVDREQRPDVDKVYMNVCQLMNGNGGWPLTIVMSPEKVPFFAGTYIPRKGRYGSMGILNLLSNLWDVWKNDREKCYEVGNNISTVLKRSVSPNSPVISNRNLNFPLMAFEKFKNSFDPRHGGFLPAPKFPSPHNFLFLLRYWKRTGDEKALRMVEETLNNMSLGGVYDHVGGGFHRYSTDSEWLVPHFEKMLYDQALISLAYAELYQITKKKRFLDILRETLNYVMRDMTSSGGGFFNAEDADSEGIEGKFYGWSYHETKELLTEEEFQIISKVYNLKPNGNYLEEATQKPTGKNILHLSIPLVQFFEEGGFKKGEKKGLWNVIKSAKHKMFKAREKRIRPMKDTKITADWNGLMVAAFSKAARVDPKNATRYSEAAKNAIHWIFDRHFTSRGFLSHEEIGGNETETGGVNSNSSVVPPPSFSTDYAFLIFGLIESYQTTYDVELLEKAIRLQTQMVERFWDEKSDGFFFSAHDGEELIARQKPIYDGAIPSANSVAFYNLERLYHITNDTTYLDLADNVSKLYGRSLQSNPTAFSFFLMGLEMRFRSVYLVTLVSGTVQKDMEEQNVVNLQPFVNEIRKHYFPHVIVLRITCSEEKLKILALNPSLEDTIQLTKEPRAFICDASSCKRPISNPSKLKDSLEF